jgi:alkaline phosphatase D
MAATGAAPLLARRAWAAPDRRFASDPFTLGVASGDPEPDGVVLWTRLAPRPLEPGGGLAPEAIDVVWEVAEDEGFTRPIASGRALATPQLGHSVHVEVAGLAPDRWYWYRFRSGEAESPVGRTRTAPRPDADVPRLVFAVTSCQNYEQGLFTAYEQMQRDEPDLVLHLGDYIYEYEAGRNGKIRTHIGNEIESLDDYRIRLALYRSDPLLSGMHAKCPWLVTWDDHEFDNNYADLVSEEQGIDATRFQRRREAAYQAYYEMMPLRARSLPRAHHLQLYRRTTYGRLAELLVLDTRQYRTNQPNDDKRSPLNEAALDPRATLLGAEQRAWLQSRLLASEARWNVLAQQVMMGMVGVDRDGVPTFSMDQWPGYAHERMELVRFLAERRIPNPVVLTGDIHSNWANELRVDDREHDSARVATEFVATSLSSGGNGVAVPDRYDELRAQNPCVRFHNRERGYVRCAVTPSEWRADFVVVDDVERPGGRCFDRASFVVEAGEARIHEA